jgi:hypothetical protein
MRRTVAHTTSSAAWTMAKASMTSPLSGTSRAVWSLNLAQRLFCDTGYHISTGRTRRRCRERPPKVIFRSSTCCASSYQMFTAEFCRPSVTCWA